MLKNIYHQLYSEIQGNSGRTWWVRIHILFIVGGNFLVKLLVKCKTLDAVLYQCTHDGKLFLAQNQVVVVFFKSVNFD